MGRTGVSGICTDSLCAGVSLVALVLGAGADAGADASADAGADAGAVKELLVKFLNI